MSIEFQRNCHIIPFVYSVPYEEAVKLLKLKEVQKSEEKNISAWKPKNFRSNQRIFSHINALIDTNSSDAKNNSIGSGFVMEENTRKSFKLPNNKNRKCTYNLKDDFFKFCIKDVELYIFETQVGFLTFKIEFLQDSKYKTKSYEDIIIEGNYLLANLQINDDKIFYEENSKEIKNPAYKNALAKTYMNRGAAYDSKTEYDKAIEDYNKCIEIMQKLFDKENKLKLYDENDLAYTYLNRGLSYYSKAEYDKSIKDYDKCIEIMYRLYNENKLYDENDLASAYMNRGLSYSKTDHDKAIEDYDKCIEIIEKLPKENKRDENSLAKAYINRSLSYNSKAEHPKVIEDYNKFMEIQKNLLSENKLDFASRSVSYRSKKEHDKAIEDYTKYIEINERLYKQNKLNNENEDDLAKAYMNRALLYDSKTEYDKAIKDYDRCIKIRGKFLQDGTPLNLYDCIKTILDDLDVKTYFQASNNLPKQSLVYSAMCLKSAPIDEEIENYLYKMRRVFKDSYKPCKDELNIKCCKDVVRLFENSYWGVSLEGFCNLSHLCNDETTDTFISGNYKTIIEDVYFYIYLIALHQRYALLNFSIRASEIGRIDYKETVDKDTIKTISKLKHDISYFNLRCSFNNISNITHQEELYELLRDKLRVEPLINELDSELDGIKTILEEKKSKVINNFGIYIAIISLIVCIPQTAISIWDIFNYVLDGNYPSIGSSVFYGLIFSIGITSAICVFACVNFFIQLRGRKKRE